MFAHLLLSAILTTGTYAADDAQGTVVKLWEHDAPGSEGVSEKEVIQGDHVSNVHQPTITAYLPSKEKATGAAVVICPGGGHRFLAIQHEGYDVAKWFNEIGVAAFVLKYRLAKRRIINTKSKSTRSKTPSRDSLDSKQGQGMEHRPQARRHHGLFRGRRGDGLGGDDV